MTLIEKTDFEAKIATMSDAEIVRAYNASEVETEEADLLAGEMERRNLDD